MTNQVVTIHSNGSLSGLERKKGFDLKSLGKAKKERVSEIVWDEDTQKWYVEFKKLHLSSTLTESLYSAARHYFFTNNLAEHFIDPDLDYSAVGGSNLIYFENYDEAVKAEIMVLDYLRLESLLSPPIAFDCPAIS